MITPEMMHSAMQERERVAAELRRQYEAERTREPATTPRSGRSPKGVRRLPLISFVARVRTASVP